MCNVFLLSPEALVAGSRRSDQSSLVVSKSGSSLKPKSTVAVAMAPSNTNSRTDRREEHDLRGCTLQDARPIWSYIVHRSLADRDNHEMNASSLHRSCHQQFDPSRRLGSWDGRWNHWSNVEKQEGLVGFERPLNPVSSLSRCETRRSGWFVPSAWRRNPTFPRHRSVARLRTKRCRTVVEPLTVAQTAAQTAPGDAQEPLRLRLDDEGRCCETIHASPSSDPFQGFT